MVLRPFPNPLAALTDWTRTLRMFQEETDAYQLRREIRRLSALDLLPMAGTCPWCGGEVGWCPTPVPDSWKDDIPA